MSNTVSLGLHTRNLGTQTRQVPNPFTGKLLTVSIDDGMTPAERDASSALLDEVGASEPDPDGFRTLCFWPDSSVNVCLGKLGGQIEIDGAVTPTVIDFIFRLAVASGMLLESTIDPDLTAVLSGQHHVGVETRWPNAAQITSSDELLAWINAGVASGRISSFRAFDE